MQYLLLIYANEAEDGGPGCAVDGDDDLRNTPSSPRNRASGQFKAGDRLKPSLRPPRCACATASEPPRTVRSPRRASSWEATPVEAKNLDEAIAIAAKIPEPNIGSIEVRPVWTREG